MSGVAETATTWGLTLDLRRYCIVRRSCRLFLQPAQLCGEEPGKRTLQSRFDRLGRSLQRNIESTLKRHRRGRLIRIEREYPSIRVVAGEFREAKEERVERQVLGRRAYCVVPDLRSHDAISEARDGVRHERADLMQ